MKQIKYLIIGGGVTGTTAAETIRQNDKENGIMIISDEPYRFYSRIMLSKPAFFLGKIPFDKIWLKTEEWYQKNNIELLAGRKAVKLDSRNKTVALDNGDKINYEKLLLAIGGHSRELQIPGSDKNGVLYLRNLSDAKAIAELVKTAKKSVIIGGGFVGFEMCEMMRMVGVEVDLVIREKKFWEGVLDEEGSEIVENSLQKNGVNIIRESEVKEIIGGEKADGIILKSGKKISADIVLVSIGVFCPYGWIKDAKIETSRGIIANEYLETNVKDIWTAGDAAEFTDIISCEKGYVGNWANAQLQGKVAALNMIGKRQPFRFVSFCNSSGFGLNIAFIGDFKVGENREIISAASVENNLYRRLIVKNNKIIGAILINKINEVTTIREVIEKGVDVLEKKDKFKDINIKI